MATFNELELLYACDCGDESIRSVQFRYGFLRLIKYRIGSVVVWQRPSIGRGSHETACVQGWINACESCAVEGDVAVIVVRGKIAGVTNWPVEAGFEADVWESYPASE